MENRRILGINRTQDASVCVLNSDGSAVAVQKERLTRTKHAWGALDDIAAVYLPGLAPLMSQPFDMVVECYSSDPERKRKRHYEEELRRTVTLRGPALLTEVSHHLSHLFSCYFPSGFTDSAVMVIDCAGTQRKTLKETFPEAGEVDGEAVEVSSYYHCEANSINCLHKSFWDVDWKRPHGLGAFYHLLTRKIFPGEGNEGKVMALASHGDASALGLPPLTVRGGEVLIPEPWQSMIVDSQDCRFVQGDTGAFERAANLAAAGQRCFEDALLMIAQWLRQRSRSENLCFAGGVALNCCANARLQAESGFKRIYIPPAPHDGGTAVGCALYGLAELEGADACRRFSWRTDYLGIPRQNARLSALAEMHPELELTQCADLPFRLAELLEAGEVIGLFQERSEFGPRALGNRSILADPRRSGVQRWVNENVKGRELFRPLAPTVLAEAAPDFFEGNTQGARFMQYAVSVRENRREQIRGVLHYDNSARIQVLTVDDNAQFYRIIHNFFVRTGIPLVLNTSFNGKEEPIVETVEDAIRCLLATHLHAVSFPPFLLRKRFRMQVPDL
ncbi:MAG: carbamoyltransferase C-terminal domain-containing protein [Bryobacteraceae bacterium]